MSGEIGVILDCPICGVGVRLHRPATQHELDDLLAERRAGLVNHYVIDHKVGGDRAYEDWPAQREIIMRWVAEANGGADTNESEPHG